MNRHPHANREEWAAFAHSEARAARKRQARHERANQWCDRFLSDEEAEARADKHDFEVRQWHNS